MILFCLHFLLVFNLYSKIYSPHASGRVMNPRYVVYVFAAVNQYTKPVAVLGTWLRRAH